jgi:hypothetical protein
MNTTIDAATLAARVTAGTHASLTCRRAQMFLDDWQERGIVEQPRPGQYHLTATGRAMFAGWIDEDDLEERAA